MSSACSAFLACLCLTAWASSALALRTIVLGPRDGQLFADAVAQYGSTGEDTTLLLPRGSILSLANVTIKNAQPEPGYLPFSSGTLTIAAAPGNSTEAAAILDVGMQFNLAQHNDQRIPFRGNAKLVIKGITMVHNCDTNVPIDSNMSVAGYSALLPTLFQPGGWQWSFILVDVTYYVRHADMTQWMAVLNILKSPFSHFNRLYNWVPDLVALFYKMRLSTAMWPPWTSLKPPHSPQPT